jgi:hypothetical protein
LVERDALQLMTGTQWLQLLYRHIPDRYEHLVRYVGWYSNRVRSQRAANDAPDKEFGSRDCAVITGFDLGESDGIKKWAAAGGRQKCTALIEKALQIAYDYV